VIDYFRLRGDRAIRSYLDLKLAREQTWIWMRKHSVSPADMDLSARMTAMYWDLYDQAFRWLLSHPYNRHGR
jgi:hypothetical protein